MVKQGRVLLISAIALNLAPAAVSQPAVSVVSPEVLPDGRVTFSLYAPKATEVFLSGLRLEQPLKMEKDGGGVWRVTAGPLQPRLYSYVFEVDGARVLDPVNRQVKKWLLLESLVEVPARPAAAYELQSVPHGALHRHYYPSKARGSDASVVVYTPPGYDPRGATRYPVLYLLHGFGDDETAWSEVGRAHFIADNLTGQGRARAMVLVMPNGHPLPLTTRGEGFASYAPRNLALVEQELLGELIPLVEAGYTVSHEAGDRAIAGLSMGGGQALDVGLRHPEVFQWVAGFSSSPPPGDLDERYGRVLGASPASTQRNGPRLLWLGCGSQDHLASSNRAFVGWLKQRGVPHTWRLTDGGHEWPLWQDYLTELVPLLFRD